MLICRFVRERGACKDENFKYIFFLLWYLNEIKFNYSGYVDLDLELAVIFIPLAFTERDIKCKIDRSFSGRNKFS